MRALIRLSELFELGLAATAAIVGAVVLPTPWRQICATAILLFFGATLLSRLLERREDASREQEQRCVDEQARLRRETLSDTRIQALQSTVESIAARTPDDRSRAVVALLSTSEAIRRFYIERDAVLGEVAKDVATRGLKGDEILSIVLPTRRETMRQFYSELWPDCKAVVQRAVEVGFAGSVEPVLAEGPINDIFLASVPPALDKIALTLASGKAAVEMDSDVDGDEAMQNFENLLGKLVRKKPNTEEIIEGEPDAATEPDDEA